jgi:hypothetical protein
MSRCDYEPDFDRGPSDVQSACLGGGKGVEKVTDTNTDTIGQAHCIALRRQSMRAQADQMLAECRIVEILSKHGEVRFFGSYALDLMAWPEIDVYVLNPDFRPPMTWDVLKDLSEAVAPTVVFVGNQIDHRLAINQCDGVMMVDFRFKHRETHWKMDISLSAGKQQNDAFPIHNTIKERLTPESSSLIRKIKELCVDSPRYLKSKWGFTSTEKNFWSYHVYTAVLRDGVSSPEEFAKYLLETRGIDLRTDFAVAGRSDNAFQ